MLNRSLNHNSITARSPEPIPATNPDAATSFKGRISYGLSLNLEKNLFDI